MANDGSNEKRRIERRRDALVAAIAFLLGWIRAWSLPTVSDGAFHLARAGSALLQGSFAPYVNPPGAEGAPPLGALLGALGALTASSPESISRVPGNLTLGATSALLAWALARRAGRGIAILGLAFVLLPPAFASAFVARPDAALAGLLLLAAIALRARGSAPATSATSAWMATLASPVAIPAALVIQLQRDVRSSAKAWAGLAGALSLTTLFAMQLAEGARAGVFTAILTGWTFPLEGWSSTWETVRRHFAFGALLIAPIALPGLSRSATGARILPPWTALVLGAIVFSEPEAFRASLGALVPATAFVFALAVDRLPAKDPEPGVPPRSALIALLIPICLMIFGSAEDRRHRRAQTEASARYAQIAAWLDERLGELEGSLLAEDTGALAAYSSREVHGLRSARETLAADAGPGVVVFRGGVRPETEPERELLADPEFLAHFAPFSFRRGPTRSIPDAVWVRRHEATALIGLDPEYPRSLLAGWEAEAAGDLEAARSAFTDAAEREPSGLGVAHEWAGVLLEIAGRAEEAEGAFREARSRDPTTVQARGYLIDRALSSAQILRADSLLTEALRFNAHEPRLWGTRARLTFLAGYPEDAVSISNQTVRLAPRDPRILMNHGSLLWARGETDFARELWRRAVRVDPRVHRYLGDFEAAPDDSPAPPLLPLFSFEGFTEEAPGEQG